MQDAAPVAEQPVRDDLDEVAGRQAPEHRAAQRDLPAVLEHPHLAPVLGLVRRRRLLERVRRRLVDRAAPLLHHPIGEREVVAPARVDLDVVGALDGVDRAVAAGDRAEPRLGVAQPHLVAPVDALPVRAGRVLEPQLAADVGDVGIGEVRDEAPERVGRPGRVRSRRTRRPRSTSRARHGPAPPPCRRAGSRAAAPAARAPRPPRRARSCVGRRVRGDDDLELLGRVVEREQVLEPPLDHRLLVVGGDDHGHRRLGASSFRTGRGRSRAASSAAAG